MKLQQVLTVFSVILSCSVLAQGTHMDEASFLGPAGSSMGSALEADGYSMDNVFINPAAIVGHKKYLLGAGYLSEADTLTASVVDTKSGPVGGAVFYLRRKIDEFNEDFFPALGGFLRKEQVYGGAFTGKANDKFNIGLSVFYHKVDFLTVQPNAGSELKEWTFSLGANYVYENWLKFGVAAHNLMEDDYGYLRKKISFGLNAKKNELSFGIRAIKILSDDNEAKHDFLLVDKDASMAFGMGLEYQVQSDYSLKFGYYDNPYLDYSQMAAGLRYVKDTVIFEYGYQHGLGDAEHQVHSVTLSSTFE